MEDWFEEPEAMNEERAKEFAAKAAELSKAYKATFSTAYGKLVLAHIKEITLDRPVLEMFHPEGMNTALQMVKREGENGLARTVLHYVNKEDKEDE